MIPKFDAQLAGRASTLYVKIGISLADYVQFITLDGNDAHPKPFVELFKGSYHSRIRFQYTPPGLGQSVYGLPSGRSDRFELIAYNVDSSD